MCLIVSIMCLIVNSLQLVENKEKEEAIVLCA